MNIKQNQKQRKKTKSPFLFQTIGSNNYFTQRVNNFRFLISVWVQGNSTLKPMGKCTLLWPINVCDSFAWPLNPKIKCENLKECSSKDMGFGIQLFYQPPRCIKKPINK